MSAVGLVVGAGTETLRLRAEHIEQPFTMDFLYLRFSKESAPQLAIARERNRKISFA